MIQGRLAAFGGLCVLAALSVAGHASSQTADLPPVDHAPFAQSPALDPPPAQAFMNGAPFALGGAWLVDAASARGPRGAGFGSPGGPMWDRPPSILRDMPDASADRGLAAPPVARYSVSGGAFVFDRSSGVALLKYDDSPEVWVLQPTPGPRGDVIYKNDVGDSILRATRLGGLTLFSSAEPGGEAAAMVASADDLQPPSFLPPNAMFQHLMQASARASRAAQHLITFDAPEVTPDSSPVFADAATAAAEAVVVMSHRDDGRAFLRRLDKMQFQSGARAGAVVGVADNGAHVHMEVIVDPAEGLAGSPSSERLAHIALGK